MGVAPIPEHRQEANSVVKKDTIRSNNGFCKRSERDIGFSLPIGLKILQPFFLILAFSQLSTSIHPVHLFSHLHYFHRNDLYIKNPKTSSQKNDENVVFAYICIAKYNLLSLAEAGERGLAGIDVSMTGAEAGVGLVGTKASVGLTLLGLSKDACTLSSCSAKSRLTSRCSEPSSESASVIAGCSKCIVGSPECGGCTSKASATAEGSSASSSRTECRGTTVTKATAKGN